MSQDFVFFKHPWHVDLGRPCNCDLDEAATLARGWPLPIWALVGGIDGVSKRSLSYHPRRSPYKRWNEAKRKLTGLSVLVVGPLLDNVIFGNSRLSTNLLSKNICMISKGASMKCTIGRRRGGVAEGAFGHYIFSNPPGILINTVTMMSVRRPSRDILVGRDSAC